MDIFMDVILIDTSHLSVILCNEKKWKTLKGNFNDSKAQTEHN